MPAGTRPEGFRLHAARTFMNSSVRLISSTARASPASAAGSDCRWRWACMSLRRCGMRCLRSSASRWYSAVFPPRETYERGQFSIPSDTACYPAKIMHGHIEELIDAGVERIFYPCLSYNIDEHASDNHFNCPVVAYYAEVLGGNMSRPARGQLLASLPLRRERKGAVLYAGARVC